MACLSSTALPTSTAKLSVSSSQASGSASASAGTKAVGLWAPVNPSVGSSVSPALHLSNRRLVANRVLCVSPRRSHNRRFAVSAVFSSESKEQGDGAAVTDNGAALAKMREVEEALQLKLKEMEMRLAAAESAMAAADRDKVAALEKVAQAEARAEQLANTVVETTEQAMAEVETAKQSFQAELAKVEEEKASLQEQLSEAKSEGINLAMKVEKMASIAVQEQTNLITEEARLKIAVAQAAAADVALEMEARTRIAADDAAAAVIEEAKATIEDAIAAAEIAKEQARTAEAALQERLGLLDTFGETEMRLMRAEEENSMLQIKLQEAEQEKENLRMDIKAAVARAEAAESRILTTQAAVAKIQDLAQRTAKEREEATRRALESMKAAAEAKEKAAAMAYKAETDSLRAAAEAAQKAETVKELAVLRRFAALQRSLAAAEDASKKWKERCLAVEELLSLIKDKGFNVLREAGDVEDLLNRGRMDVMLGNQAEKWEILAEGPRREKAEWVTRKLGQTISLPPLVGGVPVETTDSAGVSTPLPKPEEVWSIAEHQVADDVFTREAEQRVQEAKEIEEKRKELERTLSKKAAPVKRVRSPEELEEPLESGTGTGREIVFQGFNWESNKRDWYMEMAPKSAELAAAGITAVWLPPPTESVSPEGYMPVDLYNLNSKYGSMEQLQYCIDEMHNHDLLVLGDVVLNHRCAAKQNKEGIWNIFGGKLAWGPEAIVRDDPNFHGRGNPSSGDFFHAAPNIDHSQDFVRRDVKEWLRWLRTEVGYDGWRLDFARGFWGGYVKEYIEASHPAFCIGEYWDSLAYDGGNPSYNQNAHRQRIINWINATGGSSSAFDVTTKGILHSALHNEYWRLIDPQGKPPGVMGWWPSRAVTFLENHDTGSTQAHWPFPSNKIMQGYAYILTHPGTPVVFYDHFFDWGIKDQIKELLAARQHCGIHCRSAIKIYHANAEGYVAMVGDKLCVKLGHLDWNPSRQNDLMGSWEKIIDKGADYTIWEKVA